MFFLLKYCNYYYSLRWLHSTIFGYHQGMKTYVVAWLYSNAPGLPDPAPPPGSSLERTDRAGRAMIVYKRTKRIVRE